MENDLRKRIDELFVEYSVYDILSELARIYEELGESKPEQSGQKTLEQEIDSAKANEIRECIGNMERMDADYYD